MDVGTSSSDMWLIQLYLERQKRQTEEKQKPETNQQIAMAQENSLVVVKYIENNIVRDK